MTDRTVLRTKEFEDRDNLNLYTLSLDNHGEIIRDVIHDRSIKPAVDMSGDMVVVVTDPKSQNLRSESRTPGLRESESGEVKEGERITLLFPPSY